MRYVDNLVNIESLFKKNNPFVLQYDFGLQGIMEPDKILKKYGELEVVIPEIKESGNIKELQEMNTIEITLREYINEYINKKNNK